MASFCACFCWLRTWSAQLPFGRLEPPTCRRHRVEGAGFGVAALATGLGGGFGGGLAAFLMRLAMRLGEVIQVKHEGDYARVPMTRPSTAQITAQPAAASGSPPDTNTPSTIPTPSPNSIPLMRRMRPASIHVSSRTIMTLLDLGPLARREESDERAPEERCSNIE